jgi:hypothetical protein
MRDGAACAELEGRDLTEERLVVEGLGLDAHAALPTTRRSLSHD